MGKRQARHEVICDLIRENHVKTQKELAKLLSEANCACTQATVSRDVVDLGLVKTDEGFYALPEEQRLAGLVNQLVESVQAASNLVVVKTQPGAAQGVSAALDNAAPKGVLGTVAGDDTIMIAAESDEAAERVCKQIKQYKN